MDTRAWLERVDRLGQLVRVDDASWQSDIGAITEMLDHNEGSPAVLFDRIPDYREGMRVLVNANGTPERQAVSLRLPPASGTHAGIMAFWRKALRSIEPVAPTVVSSGPILENRIEGDGVDLEMFPAPIWHANDGGRFIGTASMNILRDPDSEWINVGTYRNQIFSRNTMGMFIAPGHHGQLIREKYFARKQRSPVVVVLGADPLLFMASCAEGTARGVSELEWAGGVVGESVPIVVGPHTGLPIPVTAEIAVEGWIAPGSAHQEGPYGEWHGYYSIAAGATPVIEVQAIYHRDDPILLGCPQGKPPHEDNRFLAYLKSAMVEEQLDRAGIPGVTGVWCPPQGGNRLLVVVAIEQAYPGHATQVGLVAGQVGAAAYGGRLVVVVDSDVEITDIDDVLWALMTRCDPQRDVQIVRNAWSGPLDSAVDPDDRPFNSRLILDATRPWAWRDRFPEPVTSPQQLNATRQRWGWILDRRGPRDA